MSSLINLCHNFIFEVRKISRAVNYARQCKTARICVYNEQYRALFQPTQLDPAQMGGTWKELGEKGEGIKDIQHLEPKTQEMAPNFKPNTSNFKYQLPPLSPTSFTSHVTPRNPTTRQPGSRRHVITYIQHSISKRKLITIQIRGKYK